MIARKTLFIFLLTVFLFSCATKPITPSIEQLVKIPQDDDSKNEILENLTANIKKYNTYYGKVAVTIANNIEQSSFTALLKKTSDNSLDMIVLGVFNMVMAEISYKNGELTASSRGDNITTNISNLITSDEIEDLLNYMNTAYLMPDDTYEFYYVRDFRVFYKADEDIDIYTDNTPAITAYFQPSRTVEYVMDILGRPVELFIKNDERQVRVRFLSPAAWHDSDNITGAAAVE